MRQKPGDKYKKYTAFAATEWKHGLCMLPGTKSHLLALIDYRNGFLYCISSAIENNLFFLYFFFLFFSSFLSFFHQIQYFKSTIVYNFDKLYSDNTQCIMSLFFSWFNDFRKSNDLWKYIIFFLDYFWSWQLIMINFVKH